MSDATRAGRPTFRGRPVDHVIDVRSKIEFWLGHLDGAVCIPVGTIATELPARAEIARDSRILVYCASGARSAQAAAQLTALGYRHVVDGGGMGAAASEFRA